MVDILDQIQSQLVSVVLVITLIFYLLQTLFGYKLFRASCAIVGFVAGFILGILISSSFFHLQGAWPPIIGVLAGLVIGFLAFKLFLVGLFVLVFLIAFRMAQLIPFPKTGNWDIASVIIAIGIAVIAGVLAVRFQRVVIIVITAVGGAFNSVTTFNKLSDLLSSNPYAFLIASAALSVIGLVVQFMMNRK